MSEPKGIMVTEIKACQYEERQRFWSDDEILELFPDGDGSLVNPLLRRAQAAEAEVERLLADNAEQRDRIIAVLRQTGVLPAEIDPDTRTLESLVENCVQMLLTKIEGLQAAKAGGEA